MVSGKCSICDKELGPTPVVAVNVRDRGDNIVGWVHMKCARILGNDLAYPLSPELVALAIKLKEVAQGE